MSFLPSEPPKPKKQKTQAKQITDEDAIHDILVDPKIVQMKRQSDLPYKIHLQHKPVALVIVGRTQNMLKYLPQWQDDKEVVYEAVVALDVSGRPEVASLNRGISSHPTAFQFASPRLKHDIEFIKSLAEALNGEDNPYAAVSNLYRYVPFEILEQITPFSALLLERAVSLGRLDFVQKQLSGRKPNVRELAKLFTMLIEQPQGQLAAQIVDILLPMTESNRVWEKLVEKKRQRLESWLASNATMPQFHAITLQLRGDSIFTRSLASLLCKIYVRRLGNVGADVYINKLQTLMFGSPTTATLYLDILFTELASRPISRRLSFSASSAGGTNASSAVNLEPVGGLVLRILDEIFDTTHMQNLLSDVLTAAVRSGLLPIVEILLTHIAPTTQLTVCSSDLDMTNLLLSRGADVNRRDGTDWTPLHWAAHNGEVETIRRLLQAGAEINARGGHLRHTPLFTAAVNRKNLAAAVLLEAGADPNIGDHRMGYESTVLSYALGEVDPPNIELVQLLLIAPFFQGQVQCDIHKKVGQYHNTYVHIAARQSPSDAKVLLDILRRVGADFNQRNNQGRRPLEYARDLHTKVLLIVAFGCGGKVAARKFIAMPIGEMANHMDLKLESVEDMYLGEDEIKFPVRCIPCKDVISAVSLHAWMTQPGQAHTDKCPQCRREIDQIEFMSVDTAKHWDTQEKLALKEEAQLAARKQDFVNTAQFKQLVQQKTSAEKNLQQAKEILKGAINRLKAADDKIDEAKKELNEDRRATEARIKHLRDNRLVKVLSKLSF